MLNYSDLDMNLSVTGKDGEDIYRLTAYGRGENDGGISNCFMSVDISQSDYRCFTDDEDVWFGSGDREFEALLTTFILYQMNAKERSK